MTVQKIVLFSLGAITATLVCGIAFIWHELAFVAPRTHVMTTATSTEVVTPPDTTTTTDPSETVSDESGGVEGSTVVPAEPFTISIESLPESQRAMFETFGIDVTSFVVTPGMVACAIEGIGSARVEEIRNGATPTLSEGLTLLSCRNR